MKYCSHCDINVKTTRKTCPLCFKYLEEIEDTNVTPLQHYPTKTLRPKMSMNTRAALFISLLVCIASLVVNIVTFEITGPYYWSAVVLMGVPYIWLVVMYVILGRGLLTKRIASVAVTSSILVLLVEFCVCLVNETHQIKWSSNYAIPGILFAGMGAIYIMSFVKKDLYRDSVITMLYMALLGLVPYILYLTIDLGLEWTALGCAGTAIMLILAMFIFNNRETCEEFKKIFHI